MLEIIFYSLSTDKAMCSLPLNNCTNCAFVVGDCVIAFDNVTWSKTGDLPQGNDKYYKEATIVKLKKSSRGESLADIIFTNGKKSNGHFLSALEHCL